MLRNTLAFNGRLT